MGDWIWGGGGWICKLGRPMFCPNLSERACFKRSGGIWGLNWGYIHCLSVQPDRQRYCHKNATSPPFWGTTKFRTTTACQYTVSNCGRYDIVLSSRSPCKCRYSLLEEPPVWTCWMKVHIFGGLPLGDTTEKARVSKPFQKGRPQKLRFGQGAMKNQQVVWRIISAGILQ